MARQLDDENLINQVYFNLNTCNVENRCCFGSFVFLSKSTLSLNFRRQNLQSRIINSEKESTSRLKVSTKTFSFYFGQLKNINHKTLDFKAAFRALLNKIHDAKLIFTQKGFLIQLFIKLTCCINLSVSSLSHLVFIKINSSI